MYLLKIVLKTLQQQNMHKYTKYISYFENGEGRYDLSILLFLSKCFYFTMYYYQTICVILLVDSNLSDF